MEHEGPYPLFKPTLHKIQTMYMNTEYDQIIKILEEWIEEENIQSCKKAYKKLYKPKELENTPNKSDIWFYRKFLDWHIEAQEWTDPKSGKTLEQQKKIRPDRRLLGKTKMDELPQVLDILSHRMSLISIIRPIHQRLLQGWTFDKEKIKKRQRKLPTSANLVWLLSIGLMHRNLEKTNE